MTYPPSLPPTPQVPQEPTLSESVDVDEYRLSHGRRWKVSTWTLLVVFLAVTALAVYLWVTTTQWEHASDEWETQARDLGNQVAQLDDDLSGATAELEQARDQLTTAQDRITDLADEKAQLGDENVVSQQYLDYQERVSGAAGTVATALNRCTDAQAELIGYLEDRDAYDPTDLERFASDVDELCQSAKDANTQLQTELDQ